MYVPIPRSRGHSNCEAELTVKIIQDSISGEQTVRVSKGHSRIFYSSAVGVPAVGATQNFTNPGAYNHV